MSEAITSLRRQLAEAEENLRLIRERKAAFVMSTDVPLQLIKEEEALNKQIADLRQRIATLDPNSSPTADPQSVSGNIGAGNVTGQSVAVGHGSRAEVHHHYYGPPPPTTPPSPTTPPARTGANPFIVGTIVPPEQFYGRAAQREHIKNRLGGSVAECISIVGMRRSGKSSFLLHLPRLLPVSEIIPIYVDLQSAANISSETNFCYGLVRAMERELRSQDIAVPPAQRGEFRNSPYAALEDWLDQVVPVLRERRVLLCLDEFEKLGNAIHQNKIPLTLFDELRHLIQHHDELGFLFCGVQTLDELGPNWSSYFISVRPIEMTYLELAEAHELLTNPDPAFNLGYAAGIVEQVLLETRCQPYLLQLLGEAMVTQANRHQTRVVTDALLEQACAAALKTGEPYFTNLWTEYTGSSPTEVRAGQALLHAIAHGHPLPPDATAEARAALRRLLRYHVVEPAGEGYRCEVPLVACWVRERAVLGEG